MNLAALLARTARLHPDRLAIALGREPWCSYGEWQRRAAALAAGLHAHGLAPGERVALFLDNAPQYLEALYGIWHAGLVAVPINHKLHLREVAYIQGKEVRQQATYCPRAGGGGGLERVAA